MKPIVIFSGGLDSTVLAYKLREIADEMILLSFDYGQRHICELDFAEETGRVLGARWEYIDLSGIGAHLTSALTDYRKEIPKGHYAADSMRATVVPNRNAIMLAIATGVAVANECDTVAFGAHSGDHFIYPDCRPQFIEVFEAAMLLGNETFLPSSFTLSAPFTAMTKADIVLLGHKLDVPFDNTWSCYVGGGIHCGSCGTCVERREAFQLAGIDDPTRYQSLPLLSAPNWTVSRGK